MADKPARDLIPSERLVARYRAGVEGYLIVAAPKRLLESDRNVVRPQCNPLSFCKRRLHFEKGSVTGEYGAYAGFGL